jgi:Rad3-related DNA helicase
MSILDYCPPSFTLRDNQIKILKQVETNWSRYHVIIIPAAVGSGKSLIAQTIARWRASFDESTATITPRVALQGQYQESFPDVPSLKGRGRYSCQEGSKMSCEDHHEIFGKYCEGCVYKKAKADAIESPNSIFNFHSYILGKMYKDNLILDEAHNIFPVMGDMFSTTVWKHKHKYPDNFNELEDVSIWLEKVIKKTLADIISLESMFKELRTLTKHTVRKEIENTYKVYQQHKRNLHKYKTVLGGLQRAPANFFIEHDEAFYNGRMKDCLRIRPTTLQDMPAILWPLDSTKKIVMMSGTISEVDVSYMGLQGMKVKFLDSDNPIPASNRPIVVDNPINMSWKYQEKNSPKMVEHLSMLMDRHPDTKGIIHTTYGLAARFKPLMRGNKRILWHTKDNREDILKQFLKSKKPVVLMACGFAEGIDLAGPDYGFQIISKVQWPSKADKMIDYLYTHQIERIVWDTVRTIIQQSGRICRGATDYGITYIVDGAFGNIKKKRNGLFQRSLRFWDKSIQDAIEWR